MTRTVLEVTLHAERPVVATEAVAVERVRLGKQTVTDHETVGGEVRKEQIELDNGDTIRDDTHTADTRSRTPRRARKGFFGPGASFVGKAAKRKPHTGK